LGSSTSAAPAHRTGRAEVIDGSSTISSRWWWPDRLGTQTNMNLNEVIANRANELLGGKLGAKQPVIPRSRHMSQSSNDAFPPPCISRPRLPSTADLVPALSELHPARCAKKQRRSPYRQIGRTHTKARRR